MEIGDFGEQVVRTALAMDGVETTRWHPLSKRTKSVSYDFFISSWNCLGEVKSKYLAKNGFTIDKRTLVKYKKYSDLWGYEYIFFFVDVSNKTIYTVGYEEFKKDGYGTHNKNEKNVLFKPSSEHILGHISKEDYRDFTLNYTKKVVKSYEF